MIAFCRTRKLTELVLRYSLSDLKANTPSMVSKVEGYRGGYTKEDRRRIEQKLFRGELLGVTATCALELGVDVGCLDATIHMGFPGSVSSLWQQAGRAGRGGRPSTAIMVAFDSPLDQLMMRAPEENLLNLPPDTTTLPNDNEYVLREHLLCAAAEAPLLYETSHALAHVQGNTTANRAGAHAGGTAGVGEADVAGSSGNGADSDDDEKVVSPPMLPGGFELESESLDKGGKRTDLHSNGDTDRSAREAANPRPAGYRCVEDDFATIRDPLLRRFGCDSRLFGASFTDALDYLIRK